MHAFFRQKIGAKNSKPKSKQKKLLKDFCMKKARVKCWWSWLQVDLIKSAEIYELFKTGYFFPIPPAAKLVQSPMVYDLNSRPVEGSYG